jgi:hypothetical protein
MAIHGMLMPFALSMSDIILLSQNWVSVLYIAVTADFGRDEAYTICCGATEGFE